MIPAPSLEVLAAAALGYLLGTVPFGYLLSRAAGLGDIRHVGSGSIGATNVLRTGRKDVAALTLLLDGGKGAVAALLASAWAGPIAGPIAGLAAGAAAVVGHCTTPWLGWRGGKGVATGVGVLLAWSWPAALLCCAAWLTVVALTRRSSAGALAACLAAPPLMLVFAGTAPALATLGLSAFIVARHRGNIERLLAGTEPPIGQSKPVGP